MDGPGHQVPENSGSGQMFDEGGVWVGGRIGPAVGSDVD